MSFWCYMLHCRGGAFYVGHTDDLDRRIAQHQSGALPGFTADRLPVELVWCENFQTRLEAQETERKLKGWSRAKKMALIRGDWDRVSALAKKDGPSTGSGRTGLVLRFPAPFGLSLPPPPPSFMPRPMESSPQTRCGLVAIVGAPNAGKSTLVNALVGQKVAIVSPKAQTTRARLLGIAIEGETQIMLVDTPGIFTPTRRFDRAMVQAAWGGAESADIIALVVDAKGGLGTKVTDIAETLKYRAERKLLILNKVDLADKGKLLLHAERLNALVPFAETFFVSAATGDGVAHLKAELAAAMPEGPWHFPADQVSDATDRLTASEITREQIYLQLYAELPQASAVETEKYEERADGSVEIHQQILVERPTQRAIILGKGGSRLKEIGSRARAEIAQSLGVRVHLYLHVKVKPDWDEDRGLYKEIGLDWVE